MSTPSEQLRGKLDLAYPLLRVTAEKIWSGPRVRELYPVYLATMHGIVRSAVPLITAAAERAAARFRRLEFHVRFGGRPLDGRRRVDRR